MIRTILLLLFLPLFAGAQDEPYFFKDYNYKPNIKSVKFHPEGFDLAIPVIYLNTADVLEMSFDDMDGDSKNYLYRVILCDRDWSPSNLTYFDFIDGLEEENIDEYDFSSGTIHSYTNYYFTFPNRNMNVTKSGNYLIVVYEDDIDDPIITRRFTVVEPNVQVYPKLTVPGKASKFRTHQEIDFYVNYQGLDIRNPMRAISASVVQNNRWNSAVLEISPFLINRDGHLSFDYSDKISFAAAKEWRYAPLRSLLYPPANDIISAKRFKDGWYITLEKDIYLGGVGYANFVDLNGSFVIENRDENRTNSALNSEYIQTLFTLTTNTPYTSKDVYLFGEISNWEIKPEFKCVYNNKVNGYVSKQLLKQGYYNYAYAVYDPKTKEIDFSETEGDWYLAENEYTILIYYRPMGQRYDSVIGAYRFKSTEPERNLLIQE